VSLTPSHIEKPPVQLRIKQFWSVEYESFQLTLDRSQTTSLTKVQFAWSDTRDKRIDWYCSYLPRTPVESDGIPPQSDYSNPTHAIDAELLAPVIRRYQEAWFSALILTPTHAKEAIFPAEKNEEIIGIFCENSHPQYSKFPDATVVVHPVLMIADVVGSPYVIISNDQRSLTVPTTWAKSGGEFDLYGTQPPSNQLSVPLLPASISGLGTSLTFRDTDAERVNDLWFQLFLILAGASIAVTVDFVLNPATPKLFRFARFNRHH
jgi:hypothetical protein